MDYDEDDGSLFVVDDGEDDEGCKVSCPNLRGWCDRSHLQRNRERPSCYYCYPKTVLSSEHGGSVPRPQPSPSASLTFGRI